MAEIGSSYDLHGWAPPRRQEPAIVAPSLPTTNCPRCGRPGATVEEYDSTDQSGTVRRYRLIRCPEGQRIKSRHAREPRCQHTREELHVPKIDPALRERYDQGYKAGKWNRNIIADRTGIPAPSLGAILGGSSASQERLDAIAEAVANIDSEPVAGPGLDLRSQIIEAEATKSRRPYGRQRSAPPQGPADVEAPSVYQLAEQIERLVRELLPQDPGGLLLQAAVRRGGWTGE